MKSKISLQKLLSIVGIIGLAFSLMLIFFPVSAKSITPAKIATSVAPIKPELPVRFKIPKLNIDTSVESVGLTKDGAMDSPVGPMPVGWFNLGPRLGEIGSVVIDGHSGWKNGIPAVFDNLYKLKKGDKIYVENGKGVITTFMVRESRKYNPSADARDVFFSNDGKSHLNLITCTGVWDPVAKSHSERLVVFADKVIGLNP